MPKVPLLELKHLVPVVTTFQVRAIHGSTNIEMQRLIYLFNVKSYFFIIDTLKHFDGIIGHDLLKKVNATIDYTNYQIKTSYGLEPILFASFSNVNFIQNDNADVPTAENHLQK